MKKGFILAALLSALTACGGGGGSSSGDTPPPPPAPEQFTVSIIANPEEGGSVYGSGTYNEGSTATVSISANDGYQFSHWESDGPNVTQSFGAYLVPVNQDVNLVAHFTATTPDPDPENPEEIKLPPQGKTISLVAGQIYWLAITESETFGDDGDGFWYSNDEGESWEQISQEKPKMATIAPYTERYAVALIDEAFLFTSDWGESWTAKTSMPATTEMTSAAFSSNDEHLYITVSGTSNPGLYHFDKAEGWATANHIFTIADVDVTSHAWLNGVATSTSNPSEVYITSWYAPDIWKSVDGGETFISVRDGLPDSTGPFAQGVCVLEAGDTDKLLLWSNYSMNGGASWNQDGSIDLGQTYGCPQHPGF